MIQQSRKNTDNLVHAFALKHEKNIAKNTHLDKIVIRDIA